MPSAALGRGILFRGSLRVAATTNIDWEGVRDRIPVLVVRHNFSTCYFVENAQALVCSNIFLYASTYSKHMKSNPSANNVLSKCGTQHRDININMNVQYKQRQVKHPGDMIRSTNHGYVQSSANPVK